MKKPAHLSLKDNFMERNDEKLKRILSEKINPLPKIEETQNLSKEVDSKNRENLTQEENKNDLNLENSIKIKNNPILSSYTRKNSKDRENKEDDNDPNNKDQDNNDQDNNDQDNAQDNDQEKSDHDKIDNENNDHDINDHDKKNGNNGPDNTNNNNKINNNKEQDNKEQDNKDEDGMDEEKKVNQNNPNNEDNKTCLICFDKDSDAVIMNCGHGGIFIIIIYKSICFLKEYATLVASKCGKKNRDATYVESLFFKFFRLIYLK